MGNCCSECDGTSFRTAILPALSAADAIIGELGLATTAVSVITRKWSGGEVRVGDHGDEIVQLPLWTVVEEVSNREVNNSGGRFNLGDIRVGPIRPYFTCDCCGRSTGGFTVEQLVPVNTEESTEIFYRLQQEHALGTGWNGDYSLVALERDDPLEFNLVIRHNMEPRDKITPLAL